MALLINDNCTACDACKPVCPNEAIAVGDPVYLIDALRCTECVGFHDQEACQVVCPVECCVPDTKRPGKEADLVALAVKLHPDDTQLRARIDSKNFPSRFRLR